MCEGNILTFLHIKSLCHKIAFDWPYFVPNLAEKIYAIRMIFHMERAWLKWNLGCLRVKNVILLQDNSSDHWHCELCFIDAQMN